MREGVREGARGRCRECNVCARSLARFHSGVEQQPELLTVNSQEVYANFIASASSRLCSVELAAVRPQHKFADVIAIFVFRTNI